MPTQAAANLLTPAPAVDTPVPGLIRRPDGVYADPSVPGTTIAAAVDAIFARGELLAGLDYPILIKVIYDCGPDLPRATGGELLVRLADAVAPFDPTRRTLYRAVKLQHGVAEYYFEPVYLPDPQDPDSPGVPARLEVDEFVADMWSKGIRFGIDIAAVRSAISAAKSERVTVARRLEPVPGRDAEIIEVSQDIHRSDAPRQLANGKLDLMAFQNRFPQIQKGARLLKTVPRAAGVMGFELSGMPIEPPMPEDVDMRPMAGLGTLIETTAEGEFLVAQQTGYLNVDSKTHQLAIGDKIVSRDGVSAKTTGNLQLTGDYEEFGEVQEKRVIEGESITIHADCFGNLVSRGGKVLLNRNLVGGAAHNARGDIKVKGVASGAVIQTRQGEVMLTRAESCVISGNRVIVEHAVNCEIMADEVIIKQAEGCAIAARKITIGTAGPRKQSEMLLHVLQPDSARIDEVIAAMGERVAQFSQIALQRKAEMEALTSQPEVRKYVMLASKIRKKEITLTAEQVPQFQKMAVTVGPALKAIAKVSLDVKAAETEQQAGEQLIAQLVQQRSESAGTNSVRIGELLGETSVCAMKFQPDGSSPFDLPARDIKLRVRADPGASHQIAAASSGAIEWSSEAAAAPPAQA
ncbi:MAG: flagellar assembly protein A [Gammaproteobacteria bacterium]